jgi:hypothetical protein
VIAVRFLRSSTAADRIETSGTYELLAALQHESELAVKIDQILDPRRQRAMAATIVAFVRSDLLVACRGGVIVGLPDSHDGTLVAATDSEAAQAYLDALTGLPRAGEMAFLPLSEATGEAPSQAVWLGALHRHGADHVVVNPAGPAGSAAFDRSVIRDLAPLLPQIRAPHIDRKWIDRGYRSERRDHIAAASRELARVARGTEPNAFASAVTQYGDVTAFNSPLVAATIGYLEGLALLNAGDDIAAGLGSSVAAAINGARDGFPEHCVDAILEIQRWLLGPDVDTVAQLTALTASKQALEGLLHTGLRWRAGEVEQFIAEAARRIAGATVSEQ